ncbi:hypothetical protein Ciccas_012963, partial [Cichlidogyrus casuarinus]
TLEHELQDYFSHYGVVTDVKIIYDRTGSSKGTYGFVTFMSQESVEEILKKEKTEMFVFKERKLNIGHAIKKQTVSSCCHDIVIKNHGSIALANNFQSVTWCHVNPSPLQVHETPDPIQSNKSRYFSSGKVENEANSALETFVCDALPNSDHSKNASIWDEQAPASSRLFSGLDFNLPTWLQS